MLVLDTLFNLFLNDPDLSSSPVASSLASELWDTIEQLQGIEKKPTLVITPPDEEESLEDKQKHEEQIRGEAKQWIDFVLKTACEKVLGILP